MDRKTAWVTGAASGIGAALVDALLARGAQVVATDIDEARLRERHGDGRVNELVLEKLDVADPEAERGLAGELHEADIGDVIEAGSRLQLSAALYGVGRGDAPLGESTAEGPADDVLALVDRLAADLLGSVVGPGTRVRQLASVSTTSLPALRAYLECESLYRRGRFVPAASGRRPRPSMAPFHRSPRAAVSPAGGFGRSATSACSK